MKLEDLGWNDFFARQLAAAGPGLLPARVTAEYGGCYGVDFGGGEKLAAVSGKFRHTAASAGEMPVVGDWVLLTADAPGAERLPIRAVLARKSKLSRKSTDTEGAEQPIAANADTVFIVQALDANYNSRRMERFLVAARESGAAPVVILNKADLCPEHAQRELETAELAAGLPVITIDSVSLAGYEKLAPFLAKGRTIAFIGSSGVGKSTIINNLGAARQRTAAVRESDSKGMHTTTTRRLLRLDAGALLIDTPGMKEFEAWDAPEGFRENFPEIEELALACRFTNCAHETEPGCAVRAALEAGTLDEARFGSYLKLKAEAEYQKARASVTEQLKRKAAGKKISRAIKNLYEHRREEGQ
ncbi:MAG TPA: ribosome small subunit-dependent GTPase A [Elusimicrobia bacterium]|nr:ribosome small subunit-dependent GTPase A [Elusimicrobiota bacterium]